MAIVFLSKSDIFIPICTEGGGESTGLGNIPKQIPSFFGGFPKEGTVVVLSSLTQLRRLEESDQSGNQPVLIFKTGFTHNLATERHL